MLNFKVGRHKMFDFNVESAVISDTDATIWFWKPDKKRVTRTRWMKEHSGQWSCYSERF